MESSTPTIVIGKNQVIYDSLSHEHLRVLYVDPSNENGYLIPMEGKGNIPKPFNVREMFMRIRTNACEVVMDPLVTVEHPAMTAAAEKTRDYRFGLIREIAEKEPEIYDKKKRSELLKQAEQSTGVAQTNIYRFLGLYWKNGMTKDALLPKFNNCGTARKPDSDQTSRLGRPVSATDKYGDPRTVRGKILVGADYANFRKAIEKYYYGNGTKSSLTRAYELMVNTCYSTPDGDDPEKKKLLPPDQIPSIRQFRYWYSTHRDAVEEAKKREGENKFELNHRAVTGNSETGLFGPGAVAQIDATIADYYIVRKNDRGTVIGRPVLYFVKDVHTRLVMGMHVTLESPSWTRALLALKNCADDKVEYCRKFGVEILPETWPCACLPYAITADNGEMKAAGVEDIVRQLGVTVENCPAYRGDLKGIIENSFKTLNIRLKDITPGYVDKDDGIRGGHDYRRDACLDFEQFVKIVIHSVLYYNNAHILDQYIPGPELRLLNVLPIPRELWKYGIRYESGTMRAVRKNDILRTLLPKASASVTGKGIHFNNLYYTCDVAEKENWFSTARLEGVRGIAITYDPGDIQHIYYTDKEETVHTCSLVGRSTRFEGETAENVDIWMTGNRTRCETYKATAGAQAELDLYTETTKIIDEAKSSSATKEQIQSAINQHKIHAGREEEILEMSGAAQARTEQSAYFARQDQAPPPQTPHDAIIDDIEVALKEAGLI
jgi:hypothetical protein